MDFKHFPKETALFLEDVAKNNNKEWFAENRGRYENDLLAPSKAFVEAMGKMLAKIVPEIKAVPKVDGSIFRLFKDARFHKGAPFKTHQGIIFWEGDERLKSPCFYFHIEPPFYSVGVGMTEFLPPVLAEYRKSLIHSKYSKEIIKIITETEKHGYLIGGRKRKTLPRGFQKGEKTEELLKHDAIYLSDETPINADFYTEGFMEEIIAIYKNMLPFHIWLTNMVKRASNEGKKAK